MENKQGTSGKQAKYRRIDTGAIKRITERDHGVIEVARHLGI